MSYAALGRALGDVGAAASVALKSKPAQSWLQARYGVPEPVFEAADRLARSTRPDLEASHTLASFTLGKLLQSTSAGAVAEVKGLVDGLLSGDARSAVEAQKQAVSKLVQMGGIPAGVVGAVNDVIAGKADQVVGALAAVGAGAAGTLVCGGFPGCGVVAGVVGGKIGEGVSAVARSIACMFGSCNTGDDEAIRLRLEKLHDMVHSVIGAEEIAELEMLFHVALAYWAHPGFGLSFPAPTPEMVYQITLMPGPGNESCYGPKGELLIDEFSRRGCWWKRDPTQAGVALQRAFVDRVRAALGDVWAIHARESGYDAAKQALFVNVNGYVSGRESDAGINDREWFRRTLPCKEASNPAQDGWKCFQKYESDECGPGQLPRSIGGATQCLSLASWCQRVGSGIGDKIDYYAHGDEFLDCVLALHQQRVSAALWVINREWLTAITRDGHLVDATWAAAEAAKRENGWQRVRDAAQAELRTVQGRETDVVKAQDAIRARRAAAATAHAARMRALSGQLAAASKEAAPGGGGGAVALLLVAAVAGGGYLWWRQRQQQTKRPGARS